MVKYPAKSLDATFGALADSTRRAILERLARGEARVTALAEPFAISLPAVSKHLRVLEDAGLLARKKVGRLQRCRLEARAMKNATEWLARYQHHGQSRPAPRIKRSQAKEQQTSSPRATKRLPTIFPLTKSTLPIIFNRSVNFDANALDSTFAALADPTRRAILACLAFADASVTELAAPFNVSLPAFSKHLRVLEQAGLIAREKRGRISLCRPVTTPVQAATAWIDRYRQFWEEKFDALAAYLEK